MLIQVNLSVLVLVAKKYATNLPAAGRDPKIQSYHNVFLNKPMFLNKHNFTFVVNYKNTFPGL
jgi:hypothetical protein